MSQPTPLPESVHALVGGCPGAVLLETSRFDAENHQSYLFLNPLRTLIAELGEELPKLFAQIEAALAEGCYVAGFLSYESGYALQGIAGGSRTPQDMPLAWFGVYRAATVFDHRLGSFSGAELPELPAAVLARNEAAFLPDEISLSMTPERYRGKILEIKGYIAAGATYQVNFTDRIRLRASTSPAELYLMLRGQQPVAYGALINTGSSHIVSLSPELFVRVRDRKIVTRPMKGTWPRGLDSAEDVLAALQLQNDEKNRSEHLMIVDLMRNDLGRICATGSIQVDDLFSIERYQTLLQMTSTVCGKLRDGVGWHTIFRSLFPSGSVTGAPKINTMRIIRELEESPRGIYTGAIGFFAPNGDAAFNVAIRTLVVADGAASLGVGGGIVIDSDPAAEYAECRLKAAFLTRAQPEFELIETMLWRDGYMRLALHLERLRLSCEYFGFGFDVDAVHAQLDRLGSTFTPLTQHRVRLTLNKHGRVTLSSVPLLAKASESCRVALAAERTLSTDVFYRHKTTNRALYDRLFAAAQHKGFDEVLFRNEKDEITEGAISNLFVRLDARLCTPPLRCGVLPGVFRRHLLEAVPTAEERVLTLGDLQTAEELYLCNSVRGLRRITHLDTAALATANAGD